MNFKQRIRRRHREFWTADLWQAPLIEKLAARQFAETHNVPVPELYWHGDDPRDIPFDQLPTRFVAKGTNGDSGYNVFVMVDGRNIKGEDVTNAEIVDRLLKSKNRDMESYVVEEFICQDGETTLPLDYKVHTFNGFIGAVQVYDWQAVNTRFYQQDWNSFDFSFIADHEPDVARSAPANLDELLDYASRLSRAYGLYIRVDFLLSDRGFVFGEMCATPGDAQYYTPDAVDHFSRLWDEHLGDKI